MEAMRAANLGVVQVAEIEVGMQMLLRAGDSTARGRGRFLLSPGSHGNGSPRRAPEPAGRRNQRNRKQAFLRGKEQRKKRQALRRAAPAPARLARVKERGRATCEEEEEEAAEAEEEQWWERETTEIYFWEEGREDGHVTRGAHLSEPEISRSDRELVAVGGPGPHPHAVAPSLSFGEGSLALSTLSTLIVFFEFLFYFLPI
jgi:hypothetical protein